MNDFVQTILQEISTLSESCHLDLMAFIGYFMLSILDDELELERRFVQSLKSIWEHETAMNITSGIYAGIYD